MELSEDRGLECQGICFDLTDGKIVLSVYKNLPGIKRNLAGTSFLRSFTIDDWKAINGYLMDAVSDSEEVSEVPQVEEVEEEVEEEEISTIHSERRDSSVNKTIYPSTPKVSSIPPMTKNYDGEE